MNTDEIIKKLENEKNFVGVFPRDRLPKRTGRPAGLVINMDKAKDSGSHWVAYFISANGSSEYFDPLGEPPPRNEIQDFLKRNGSNGWLGWNNIPFQSSESGKCGEFCILFLRNRLKGRSTCEVHALLSQNSAVNDSIV